MDSANNWEQALSDGLLILITSNILLLILLEPTQLLRFPPVCYKKFSLKFYLPPISFAIIGMLLLFIFLNSIALITPPYEAACF